MSCGIDALPLPKVGRVRAIRGGPIRVMMMQLQPRACAAPIRASASPGQCLDGLLQFGLHDIDRLTSGQPSTGLLT